MMENLKQNRTNILIGLGLLLIIGFVVWPLVFSEPEVDDNQSQAEADALSWLENQSPTFTFDGFDYKVVSTRAVSDCQNCYLVTVEFKTRAAGFGDRSDSLSAQVITDRVIEILVQDGQVVEAIIDSAYSDIQNEEITEEYYDNWLENLVSETDTTEITIEGNNNNQEEDNVITEPETMSVLVFFHNQIHDPEALDCSRMWPVTRNITATPAVASATLSELLQGPTAEEVNQGYVTNINNGVEVNNLKIEDRVAYADFNTQLDENVGGSCRVQAIRAQIESTLKQFSTVDDVIISINGEVEDILQP